VSWWERVVTTFDAAWTAGYLAWNQQALLPSLDPTFKSFDSRSFRYAVSQAYVNGNPYGAAFSSGQISRKGLYTFIRDVLNVPAPLVELYVGEVYGGSLDMHNAEHGAIPVETEHEALRKQIVQLWRNSNWQSDKSLFVRMGATFGDVAVKVVDDRLAMQTYLEVLHPAKIRSIERDSKADITYARIEYERGEVDTRTGNVEATYTYREDITPTEFRTFKDDRPFAYFKDAIERPVSVWRNDYGFVPLEVVQHKDVGQGWGLSAFHHTLNQIDEINDAWSLLNDNVRKAVNIVWAFKNAKSDVEFSTNKRDQTPMLFLGENGQDPFAMVPNIDITAAGQNIINMTDNLMRAIPEYALHQVRDKGQMTAPGIRAGWSDAIDRIIEARGNYDGGLVRLQKMGVFIGAMMRYPGFEDQRYTSLEDERLEHGVAERPVIEDQLSEKEQMDMIKSLPDGPAQARLILERLHISEETIVEIVAELKLKQQQNQMNEQAKLQGGTPGQKPPAQLPAGQGPAQGQPQSDPDVDAEVERIVKSVMQPAA
jgi:hypothetical protein